MKNVLFLWLDILSLLQEAHGKQDGSNSYCLKNIMMNLNCLSNLVIVHFANRNVFITTSF